MKARYDLESVERKFEPGQKVLALLPVPGSPLQARFFGPYVVLSDLNYVLLTPDRRKQRQLYHINMLKEYVDRNNSATLHRVSANVAMLETDETVDNFKENADLPGTARPKNSDVLQDPNSKLSHFSQSQRQDLEHLLHEFEHLFPGIPNRTDAIYHDVVVGDATPVKQHPYRLTKQKYLHDEIQYLLENDFIETSKSN